MQEIWKPIEGYEGRYEISTLGRVKSYCKAKVSGRLMAICKDRNGYCFVNLRNHEGKRKQHYVHRLVASAFIENIESLPQINHKDEDKENNCVENLEWCSISYNVNYGHRNELTALGNMNHPVKSMPVFSVDFDGSFNFYPSIGEAARQSNNHHANIVAALKGRISHCGRRYWFYSITTPTHLANND